LFTETRNTSADNIATVVGGNRYGWLPNIDIAGGIELERRSFCRSAGGVV
jgi:hypothetical protein